MKFFFRIYVWRIIVSVLLILIPIVLAFIIHIPKFTSIAGDESDWITFWGAYLGPLFAFAIYKLSSIENKKKNEQEQRLHFLSLLRYDINKTVCSLKLTSVTNCCCFDHERKIAENADVTRLEDYKLEINNVYNSFYIVYEDLCNEYIEDYYNTLQLFVNYIDSIIKAQLNIENDYNIHEIEEHKRELTTVIINTTPLVEAVNNLWECANSEIKRHKARTKQRIK